MRLVLIHAASRASTSAAEVSGARADGVPVLVFTRTPVPGKVKTRLVPVLGARGAARVHRAMLRRTLVTAAEAGCGSVELWCSPSVEHRYLAHIARTFGVALALQSGADLGVRMHRALCSACAHGAGALLVGSDCPSLEVGDLQEAADALEQGADAVLGPAHDGGYYLIGVRRSDVRLFSGIRWGASGVLDATRERLRTLGWGWRELAVRHDVDRPEDLANLEGRIEVPGRVRAPIF